MRKPGRDPRPAFKAAVFKEGVETLNDLQPGMVLEGAVTNVAAFGAFVDIGVHQDGLVHVSAMSRTFIKDPREVVKPGDIVRVKVLEVDKPRKRISLTLRLDDEVGSKSDRMAAGAARADSNSGCHRRAVTSLGRAGVRTTTPAAVRSLKLCAALPRKTAAKPKRDNRQFARSKPADVLLPRAFRSSAGRYSAASRNASGNRGIRCPTTPKQRIERGQHHER